MPFGHKADQEQIARDQIRSSEYQLKDCGEILKKFKKCVEKRGTKDIKCNTLGHTYYMCQVYQTTEEGREKNSGSS